MGARCSEETECLGPATAMKVLEAKVMSPTMLEFDRKAREAGRLFVDRTVAVARLGRATALRNGLQPRTMAGDLFLGVRCSTAARAAIPAWFLFIPLGIGTFRVSRDLDHSNR
jgi:hypothetical protein